MTHSSGAYDIVEYGSNSNSNSNNYPWLLNVVAK